jgi:hypothetical protein
MCTNNAGALNRLAPVKLLVSHPFGAMSAGELISRSRVVLFSVKRLEAVYGDVARSLL